jgi:hypothetical protein
MTCRALSVFDRFFDVAFSDTISREFEPQLKGYAASSNANNGCSNIGPD